MPQTRLTWALLLLLLMVIGENSFLIYFASKYNQMQADLTRVQTQVAQLQTWKSSVMKRGDGVAFGQPPVAKGNGGGQKGGKRKGGGGGMGKSGAIHSQVDKHPMARFVAKFVILESAETTRLDDVQLTKVRTSLDQYQARLAELQPMQRKAAEMWNQQDAVVFNDAQRTYLATHADQVETKADELILELKRDDGALVERLDDMVRDKQMKF